VGRAIAERTSGTLCLVQDGVERRLVLREGDLVTCASDSDEESLIAFLGVRGDLPREAVRRLGPHLASSGRHAGAALVARGTLPRDQMWPTLRAHAEWLLGRAIQARPAGDAAATPARATIEAQPSGRLASEPSVFGGASGAEVFVDVVRRVVSPTEAIERLGGLGSRLGSGSKADLVTECGLAPPDLGAVRDAAGATIGQVLDGVQDADFASALFALVQLGILEVLRAVGGAASIDAPPDAEGFAIDAEATRERVRARLALVDDGDYFAVLGVSRDATGYEVRRAFLELRRAFDPSRLVSAELGDLAEDVLKIATVLEEAYEILKDSARRARYRRAIEGPPQAP
jgi:hypothetical protein